jgi:hypothetical protein
VRRFCADDGRVGPALRQGPGLVPVPAPRRRGEETTESGAGVAARAGHGRPYALYSQVTVTGARTLCGGRVTVSVPVALFQW